MLILEQLLELIEDYPHIQYALIVTQAGEVKQFLEQYSIFQNKINIVLVEYIKLRLAYPTFPRVIATLNNEIVFIGAKPQEKLLCEMNLEAKRIAQEAIIVLKQKPQFRRTKIAIPFDPYSHEYSMRQMQLCAGQSRLISARRKWRIE